MSRSDKKEKGLWARGVVLSFDLVTQDLKDNYSNSSPQGAYDVIKRYLLKNGFEHLKDTDYKHDSINKLDTVDLLYKFSKENKWFPYCIKKVNISPNITTLDISDGIKAFQDEVWKKDRDKDNVVAGEKKPNNNGLSLSDYKSAINKMKQNKSEEKKSGSHKKDRDR